MSFWSRIERRLTEFADELVPDEFRADMEEARSMLAAGRPGDAAELLERMLAERPEHAGALSLLGAARLELGAPASALSAFDQALARAHTPEALVGRGQANLALGDTGAAVRALRSAIDAAGGDRDILAGAYRGLGLAYRRSGDTDKAVRELRKAVAEDPADAVARSALADALLASSRVSVDEARQHARRVVEEGQRAPLAWVTLGTIALGEDHPGEARAAFERALAELEIEGPGESAGARVDALVGLGDAALAAGTPADAHTAYLRALELAPVRGDIHARIGDAHRRVDNAPAALASFERAADLGAGADALRRGVDTALAHGEIDAAVRLANRLLDEAPDDPRALVARGVALARDGQTDAARATFETALAARADPEARVALGRLELGADPERAAGTRAAEQALAALREQPGHGRARELLAAARARELGVESEPRDLYELVAGLQRVALARRELAGLAGDIARAASDLDQPLLVTVMGEFSSGKSTFVNAFAGDDVAPTGITPTTATINVVKYGRERGGRIVRRDGAAEELGWETLQRRLAALDAAAAREVELVEILLPLPALERVHIVDTPGLNSILPEHEEVARGFIGRADAVVWLFTAGQAGKASERGALQSIRDQGKRVLGVLNKIDQLGPGEAGDLTGHVESQLGELVEAVVPVSARRAREGDASGSNWEGLSKSLEDRFFARARELKRQACARRLGALIDTARDVAAAERGRAAEAAAELREAAAAIARARDGFADDIVRPERRALSESARELYRRAAREVLELVRPRRLPFGSHSAAPADRDYLLALLDAGLEDALEPGRRRALAGVTSAGAGAIHAAGRAAPVVGDDTVRAIERAVDDAVRWVDSEAFGRARAFVRGYLRGGYVDAFFLRHLPKLELTEDAVYRALQQGSPDLDTAIAAPLASAGEAALAGVADRLIHLAGVADVLAFDLDSGLTRALTTLAGSLPTHASVEHHTRSQRE